MNRTASAFIVLLLAVIGIGATYFVQRINAPQIAAEQQIPLNSSLYQAGLQQFQANLKALLHRYQQAGVPVILSSIASNERQPPFSSSQPALTLAPEPQQARQQLQLALQQHSDVASWHFHSSITPGLPGQIPERTLNYLMPPRFLLIQ